MSKEHSDVDYKPRHNPKGTRNTPCKTRTKFVSRAFQGYKSDSGVSTFVNIGSPERYLLEQEVIVSKQARKVESMAKQKKSQMEVMMEMFARMREEDMKREEERAMRREEKKKREEEERKEERKREEEQTERSKEEERREQKQQQLILQLRDSQPAVPQTVNITQNKLPPMTDSDDIEAFITQLEIAMKSAGIPKIKWKHNMLIHLTVNTQAHNSTVRERLG